MLDELKLNYCDATAHSMCSGPAISAALSTSIVQLDNRSKQFEQTDLTLAIKLIISCEIVLKNTFSN